MSFQQLVTPNPKIPCQPGWCLQYVRQAFGAPIVEPTATAGWANAEYKHVGEDFPGGFWAPLWFDIPGIPEGHVVLGAPDRSLYSTSSPANTPVHHPSLEHLLWYYGPRVEPQYRLELQYLGWSEDISNVRVVQPSSISVESATEIKDIIDMATPDELNRLLQAADRINGVITDPKAEVLTTKHLPAMAATLLNTEVPWYGFDGNRPTQGRDSVNLAAVLGWHDTGTAGLAAQNAALRELVTQLSVAQGVTINYAAIAKAVNDDAAARMKG